LKHFFVAVGLFDYISIGNATQPWLSSSRTWKTNFLQMCSVMISMFCF